MEIFASNIIFAFSFGPVQILIILGLGVLLFGSRLPEIGRNLGLSLLEFKKGLNELRETSEKSIAASVKKEEQAAEQLEEQQVGNVPKFEPPV